MGWRSFFGEPRNKLDVFAGLVDGVLNALTLAAGRIVYAEGLNLSLVGRVAVASGLTTIFVFFVAHYAELRAELARAERQLNLTAHGRLAASHLGRVAIVTAMKGALLAALCGTIGATVPLLLCIVIPDPPWAGICLILIFLAALGALLARSFEGSIWLWSSIIVVAGIIFACIGTKLNLVQ